MQLLAEQSVDIACPVAAVYDYATNLEHFGEWFPGVIGVVSADDLAHASVGKAYRETVDVPGRGRVEVGIHVREARPDAWLATEGDLSPLLPRMEMQFAALTPHSCRLTWRMGSRHPGDDEAVRTALWPAASRLLSQRAVEGLARLKQRLEQHAPA
ncbi:MAG TPA: SRPBCC family protein [Burkholderiaceae bacterium]|nr:SRPBCC family protein [Burkholderiaceae bacterium]